MDQISKLLEDSPIIAAVKDESGMEAALASDCQIVFLLYGTICNLPELVERLKKAGKTVIVHVDLIMGLASKEISVDFIRRNTCADGIISTKPQLIKYAREAGLLTVQRIFMLDSLALENCRKYMESNCVDMIEILPGIMPKIIRKIARQCKVPLIAGGLITDKEDVMLALQAGAMGVSSTNHQAWQM